MNAAEVAGLESAAAEVGLSEGALSNDAGSLKGDMDASRLTLGSSTSAGTFTGFGLALMPGSTDCWTEIFFDTPRMSGRIQTHDKENQVLRRVMLQNHDQRCLSSICVVPVESKLQIVCC